MATPGVAIPAADFLLDSTGVTTEDFSDEMLQVGIASLELGQEMLAEIEAKYRAGEPLTDDERWLVLMASAGGFAATGGAAMLSWVKTMKLPRFRRLAANSGKATPEQQREINSLEDQGVRIATDGDPILSTGEISPILKKIRQGGGTIDISRGEISAQELAALSRASGNEMAIIRDRASGQLKLIELGPQMGEIPLNSRLIIHTHPGSNLMSVIPSSADRHALVQLNQRSSVIINSDGTYTVRFRPDNHRRWQHSGCRRR